MSNFLCPICDVAMEVRCVDHVGAYLGLDRVLTVEGDLSLHLCRKCGVFALGLDQSLLVSAD